MNEPFSILVIDDEPAIRDSCLQILSRKGCDVCLAVDGMDGLTIFNERRFDVVILDMKLPDMSGIDVFKKILAQDQDAVVIFITAYPMVEFAVSVMKLGAFDYLPKPFSPNTLRTIVVKALEKRRAKTGALPASKDFDKRKGSDAIIGGSSVMAELKRFIKKAGMSDCSVLITGETGTGKELVARALHYFSRRRNNNFITVDSGSLSDTLIESELFGHMKGSFTGAHTNRIGRFEMAHKGTLFFDEISNMSSHVQSKLLRVLQEHELTRVGSSVPISVNVRIIAATNKDLTDEIGKGNCREDLYYRLNVISLHLPPLRERREDIPLLANYFLSLYLAKTGSSFPERISEKAMEVMLNYDWPGNVRELENVIERAVVLSDEQVVDPLRISGPYVSNYMGDKDSLIQLEDVEIDHIEKMLKKYNFNKFRTAKALGIDRKTLRNKISKYGIGESDELRI